MDKFTIDMLNEDRAKLQAITEDCRDDMHEPEEQELYAKVTGRTLDNAGVDGELTVRLSRDGGPWVDFNLANLLNLARMAVLPEPK